MPESFLLFSMIMTALIGSWGGSFVVKENNKSLQFIYAIAIPLIAAFLIHSIICLSDGHVFCPYMAMYFIPLTFFSGAIAIAISTNILKRRKKVKDNHKKEQ